MLSVVIFIVERSDMRFQKFTKKILFLFGLIIYFLLNFRVNTYALDLSSFDEIKNVTTRMLLGFPTTELENIGVAAPNLNIPVSSDGRGYIIIGDSRACGLNVACQINNTPDNWFCVACASQGLSYLKNIGIPTAQSIEYAHPEISQWMYIICLGVNDLSNINGYCSYLSELGKMKNITFVSVNPIFDNDTLASTGKTSANIQLFNYTISKLDNIRYIDTCTYMLQNGFQTEADGLHYTIPETIVLYNLIKALCN